MNLINIISTAIRAVKLYMLAAKEYLKFKKKKEFKETLEKGNIDEVADKIRDDLD